MNKDESRIIADELHTNMKPPWFKHWGFIYRLMLD